MSLNVESYIDPAFVYRFRSGPDVIRSRADALREGINCVSLAHIVLAEMFDYRLPPDLLCTEMYQDREHFREIPELSEAQAGDLVWFGLQDPPVGFADFVPQYRDGDLLNWADFPVKHVAIHTGRHTDDGPLLLHSTHRVGTNAVWPIREFAEYRQYKKSYGVTRLHMAD